MRNEETMTMARGKTEMEKVSVGACALLALATIVALALGSGLLAAPASASQEISEFSVGSSSSQAGGHPDLTARVKLAKSGEPEVAKNVTVNLPAGVFGNPGAIFRCRAAVFVVNECQAGAQVGLVTIVANYEGDPNRVLGTAPIYNMETVSENEAARLAFIVPVVDVPVVVPIQVRSESDYGLQLSINSISQTLALTSASIRSGGFPPPRAMIPKGSSRANREPHPDVPTRWSSTASKLRSRAPASSCVLSLTTRASAREPHCRSPWR